MLHTILKIFHVFFAFFFPFFLFPFFFFFFFFKKKGKRWARIGEREESVRAAPEFASTLAWDMRFFA